MDPACRPTRTIKNLRKRYPIVYSVPYAADSPCNLNGSPWQDISIAVRICQIFSIQLKCKLRTIQRLWEVTESCPQMIFMMWRPNPKVFAEHAPVWKLRSSFSLQEWTLCESKDTGDEISMELALWQVLLNLPPQVSKERAIALTAVPWLGGTVVLHLKRALGCFSFSPSDTKTDQTWLSFWRPCGSVFLPALKPVFCPF